MAAHDLGLGSVYVTGCKSSNPEVAQEIRNLINLPENIMPITILPIGYPDQSEIPKKKDLVNVSEVTHYNNW